MVSKKKILKQIDKKISNQLIFQENFLNTQSEKLEITKKIQAHLNEEKASKEFQKKIKSIVYEIRTKAENFLAGNSSEEIKQSASIVWMMIINRYGLKNSIFEEVNDKEFCDSTIELLNTYIKKANTQLRNNVVNYIENVFKNEEIENMKADFLNHYQENEGKVKLMKILSFIPPFFFFRKTLIYLQENAIYSQFRGIAAMTKMFETIWKQQQMQNTSPNSFFALEKYPFLGQYPDLENVKTLKDFYNYTDKKNLEIQGVIDAFEIEFSDIKLISY
ncbi:hypothetical protein EHQ23_09060 [Leptospira bourretii]|uniref:Uncharacterized protein n=1 Tax=Leptospira bourretii TaxID=2484962 RepID=A0A4R9ILX1_9LEPT|nr:hypothetical protein [Leptospira bourretii]TGK84835.1 hypothetical protein EHQ23_09060 [Leptospira bourretii]TGK90602.1 hypothetical protein EHQ26_10660 [Leptospira bourretii]